MIEKSTLRESFKKRIEELNDLLSKIKTQTLEKIESGQFPKNILTRYRLAQENIAAANLHFEACNYEEAMYFLTRGCWHLGYFQGQVFEIYSVKDPH